MWGKIFPNPLPSTHMFLYVLQLNVILTDNYDPAWKHVWKQRSITAQYNFFFFQLQRHMIQLMIDVIIICGPLL